MLIMKQMLLYSMVLTIYEYCFKVLKNNEL
jgi:hypothetical protein